MTPDRVKAIRAALNMTQAEFAVACGSNIRTIAKWEGGERTPRGAAVRLLEGLEVQGKKRNRPCSRLNP